VYIEFINTRGAGIRIRGTFFAEPYRLVGGSELKWVLVSKIVLDPLETSPSLEEGKEDPSS